MKNKQLPEITGRRIIAESNLFAIEQVDLSFSNGEKRQFERMSGSGRGAVMIVPMLDNNTMLLVREYCTGTHNYQLGFPKGLIDPGEQPVEAANRELQEEIGFAANKYSLLQKVSTAPAFFNAQMDIFIAEDLYQQSLVGDEPEPLEIVKWRLDDYQLLLEQEDFTEARSIAALLLAVNKYEVGNGKK